MIKSITNKLISAKMSAGEFFKKSSAMSVTVSLLFFSFICWLILLADLDKENLIIYIGHKVPFGDKIGHFLLFGLLALLINIPLRFRTVKLRTYKVYLGSVVVLVFAVIEECSQLAFASRTFDLVDMLFDGLGVLFFSSVWFRKALKSIISEVAKSLNVNQENISPS